MAEKLKAGFKERGFTFYLDSPTNQQFIILSKEEIAWLSKKVSFDFWYPVDENHQVVRFATSWATKEEDIDMLMNILDEMKQMDKLKK